MPDGSVNRRDFLRASVPAGLAASSRAQSTGAAAGRFFAGAATSNITPSLGSRLGGNYWSRIADEVHDELHVRSLVLDNGRTRLAIAVVDSCMLPGSLIGQAREMIQQATGIPAGNILVSATHTHAAPPTAHILQSLPEPKYVEWLTVRIADSVRLAVKRLQPARLGWAVGREDRILFTRRYYMKPGSVPSDPFGGANDKVRTSPRILDPNIVGPEGPVDPEVGVLALESLDGRPICLLGNYGLHSIGEIRPGDISADYFGAWAESIARMAGVSPAQGYPPFVPIMANGCSGCSLSVNPLRPQVKYVLYDRMYRIAEIVAAATLTTWRNVEYQDWAELGASTEELELAVRLPSASDVNAARKILAAAPSEGQFKQLPQIYARETVIMSETFPKTVKVPIQALRIGGLGIVTFPGEAFPQLGLEVKAKSRFKPTLCIELANDYHGYLPTVEAHANGGYETWRAKSSYLEVQAAPKMVAAALRGLAGLSG